VTPAARAIAAVLYPFSLRMAMCLLALSLIHLRLSSFSLLLSERDLALDASLFARYAASRR
jgi:hypothetical protein